VDATLLERIAAGDSRAVRQCRYRSEKGAEATFVAMIARRRMIDRIRSAERAAPMTPIPEDMDIPSDDHRRVERGAEAALAAKALDTLKPQQREVVVLSVLHGLTHEEIARKLDMPLGTVKSFLRRGLIAVRRHIGADAAGEGVSA